MALPRWLLSFALPADMHDIVGRSQRVSDTRFKNATGWSPSIPDQRTGWGWALMAAKKTV